jgi:hypothetical protein
MKKIIAFIILLLTVGCTTLPGYTQAELIEIERDREQGLPDPGVKLFEWRF